MCRCCGQNGRDLMMGESVFTKLIVGGRSCTDRQGHTENSEVERGRGQDSIEDHHGSRITMAVAYRTRTKSTWKHVYI